MGKKAKEMNVKISDDALRGNYSNGIHIGFSNQEFSLDFINNIDVNNRSSLMDKYNRIFL